ncbi:MAG: ribonuclease HII [Acidobacteriia bacterium]|nr:ribonuclease HII [Terriglobia bacterium]
MARARDARDFTCTRHYESQAHRLGWRRVAGCDEAGRGSLLGPLFAAAVILDPDKPIPGVDDSKKLTSAERLELDAEIREKALAFHVVAVSAAEVDEINVYEASRQAMLRALVALAPAPDFVLTDAMPLVSRGQFAEFTIPYRAIVHGDARSVSIAAASILAKVARDAHLEELDRIYPRYLLARNKGYGTAEHLEALARFGPCPEHRKTFQPVKDYLLPLFPFSPAV